ncbi:type II secretion system protein [bacterium]|nr:type II secretion system protein [bacterium]
MKTNRRSGFTLIELLIVISIIGILAGMGIATYPVVMAKVYQMQCSQNLRSMYSIFLIYSQEHNAYPTTQPPLTRYERGGGVRDLWPLFDVGVMQKEQLELLKCPQSTVVPFSSNPTIDEFDKKHISYSYNSTAIPNDPNNPPIMADRGVSSGVLNFNAQDVYARPNHKTGVNVLLANGRVVWVSCDRRGKLSRSVVAEEQWGRLLD